MPYGNGVNLTLAQLDAREMSPMKTTITVNHRLPTVDEAAAQTGFRIICRVMPLGGGC